MSTTINSTEPDVSRLMTVEDAIDTLDAIPTLPRVEYVPLENAVGRRLAEDVVADRDYPPFDKAMMDGYAAPLGEEAGQFEIIGEVVPGSAWDGPPVTGRRVVAIMTGAPVPPGEVGIIPVEQTRRDGDTVHLEVAPEPERSIARRGSDRVRGDIVLRAGTQLGPQHIAALASVGCSTLRLYARPRCAVMATGNEVVPVDATPEEHQTRNSNTPMLVTLLNRMGFDAYDAGHVGDDAHEIHERLRRQFAFEHPSDFDPQPDPNLPDAIFLTGGMSMGEHDFVWRAIDELTNVKIAKLRIKPGKPFVFGHREAIWNPPEQMTIDGDKRWETHHQYVFGLPGNPVSAFVCIVVMACRLLTRASGEDVCHCDARFHHLPLTESIKANGPRTLYQPAKIEDGHVVPLAWHGSADVFTLAEADALIERPENDPARDEGDSVRVLRFPGCFG